MTFLTALLCNVSDIRAGIDNATFRGVFQTAKKLTSMVSSTDVIFLGHDVPAQSLLISSQMGGQGESYFLSGE